MQQPGTRPRTQTSAPRAGPRRDPDTQRARRDVSRPARHRAGDDREAPLAAQQGDRAVRAHTDQRARAGRDRRLADDDPLRAPVRGHPGAAPDPRPRGQLGHAQHKPGRARRHQPPRPRIEQHPFESKDQLRALADRLGRRLGPLVLFAAATGLRPSERLALELRDIDEQARVVYVRRAYRNGRIKCPKTDAGLRAVPLQSIALEALDALPRRNGSALVFPAPRGGYLDLHNFRYRDWDPPSATSGSNRSEGSTISDIPLPRSRSAPASRPSTSPATWAPASP